MTGGIFTRFSWGHWLGALALAGGISACGGGDPAGPSGAEGEVSSIELALSTVPSSTACIRITATPSSGGAATVKTFTVTSGSSTTSLSLAKLLPGAYTFSGDAFTAACTSIGSVGDWISDQVPVTLKPGFASNTTLTFRKNPTPVVNANFVNNVLAIAQSADSTFILTDSGFLQSGSASPSKTFVRSTFSAFDPAVYGAVPVIALSATNGGACAVRSDGTVWCWGVSYFGELGAGILLNNRATTPVQVTGLTEVTTIASADYHTCVIGRYNGSASGIYCWGSNSYGELGNGVNGSGATVSSSTPVSVGLPYAMKSLAMGLYTSYAVDSTGNTWAWGYNGYGQFGDGTTSSQPSPVQTYNKGTVAYQTAGYFHSCTVGFDGAVRCYGYNGYGQLGNGSWNNSLTGVTVPGITAKQLVSGNYANCALTTAGQTLCWGVNTTGQIGDLTSVHRWLPTPTAPGAPPFVSLVGGYSNFLALTASSDLYGWGSNSYGSL